MLRTNSVLPSWKCLIQRKIVSRGYHYNSDRYEQFGYKHQTAVSQKHRISSAEVANRAQHANLFRVITSYRTNGHRASTLNPLENKKNNLPKEDVPELDPNGYNLNFHEKFYPLGLLNGLDPEREMTVGDAVQNLKSTYCGVTGYEFMYVEDESERDWLAREIESRTKAQIPAAKRLAFALEMAKSQNLDHFLASKFPTLKRYGGEGAESVMAFYLELFDASAMNGVNNIVISMAHRGRLNFLAGPLALPPVELFHKIKGYPEFAEGTKGSGDILSHLGTSVNLTTSSGGQTLHVSLLNNPAHLEAIHPVAVGKCRAKQHSLLDYDYALDGLNEPSRVLCLQVHGDAAISAQGVNQETLSFANVPHFRIGGSVHLVINNQIGFTTPPEFGRSSRYATDIAKMISAPVIHVNAAFPEEVAKAARLALAYRQEFRKDIFVDFVCFRRWGHNEMDDPTYTNPQMYKLIHSRKSLPDEYCEHLQDEKILSKDTLQNTLEAHTKLLTEQFMQADEYVPPHYYLQLQWKAILEPDYVSTTWDTGTGIDLLRFVGAKSVECPPDFKVHHHLVRSHVQGRLDQVASGQGIDWSTAEALAFGSLLHQGFGVRISGEDVGRGTFSQRHAMLVDQDSGETFVPLNSMCEYQGAFLEVQASIANSTLSEEAVLGYEYGYSTEHPDNLVIWEAQYGDFCNAAQVMIDTLVASGEIKWLVRSGLVMLLPHGIDGSGPDHSSCRIERFLQLSDSSECGRPDGDWNNFQVLYPTTPAQYFHILRGQVLRNFRKPAIVVAPKILLRLAAATSNIADMGPGTHFKPVLGETCEAISPFNVKKIIFVSGKHYYNLRDRREELGLDSVALIRLESLCPFPVKHLEREIAKYPNATDVIWSQEEHRNQGAWSFVQERFQNFLGKPLRYVGRGVLAASAVGVPLCHRSQLSQLLQDSFADQND